MTEPACRVCGCTQNNACLTADGPCHWVEPDLCSACAPRQPHTAIMRNIDTCQDCGNPRLCERFDDGTSTTYIHEDCPTPDACHDKAAAQPADFPPKSDDPTLWPPIVG